MEQFNEQTSWTLDQLDHLDPRTMAQAGPWTQWTLKFDILQITMTYWQSQRLA